MARKPLPNALTPPDAGDEWVGLREAIPQLFEIAKIAFGEKEARRLYQAVLARGRGRPPGSKRAPEKDDYLLTAYYRFCLAIFRWEASAQPRPYPHRIDRLTRFIATRLDRNHPGEYGASIKAIETKLRRLRKAFQPPPTAGSLPTPRPGLINSAPPRD